MHSRLQSKQWQWGAEWAISQLGTTHTRCPLLLPPYTHISVQQCRCAVQQQGHPSYWIHFCSVDSDSPSLSTQCLKCAQACCGMGFGRAAAGKR